MASTSSPTTRKKPVHPHPAHKCAYGPCCNYAVPPAKGRKHRCCSEECLAGLLVELRQYIPCRTCNTWFSGTGTRVHCPSCLATSRPSKQLPPHRCGYRKCCHYIVPPNTAKKYLFCSDDCRRAQRSYGFNYATCQTVGCEVEIKRDPYATHCPDCLIKREAKRELARQSERWPKKKCLWAYCQKEFQPGAATQGYCSAECRKIGLRGHSGPGYPREMPPANHVFCEGNCGAAFREGHSSPWGTEWTRCTPCWLGQQNSVLHPFGPPLRPGWHRCQWVFCNALYRAERPDQRACCTLHEKLREARTPGRLSRYDRTHAYSHHTCANHCGTTLLYASQPVCLPCLLGLRYGRVNPFCEDAGERARWGEQVVHLTDRQLAAEWDHLLPPEEESTPVARPFQLGPPAAAARAHQRSPRLTGPAVRPAVLTGLAGLLAAGLCVWWAAGKRR